MTAPRIGLALSGGGARGIAHLGVLAALDEIGIKPAHVSGVSSGAIVAAFYAAGWEPRRIFAELVQTNIRGLLKPAFSAFGLWGAWKLRGGFGLLRLDAVEVLFARLLGEHIRFEDLSMPLTIGTADLNAGEAVFYQSGLLLPPLLASVAVPVIYQPVAFDGRLLVDGGLLNNLPVEPLTGGALPCTTIIGVHTNPVDPTVRVRTLRGVLERTLHLAINNNVRSRLVACDVVIEPPALRRVSPLRYSRAQDLFRIGYEHTLTLAPALERLVGDGE